MERKKYSERDICTEFINPSLINAGWDLYKQIREKGYFTAGLIPEKGLKSFYLAKGAF